MPCLNRLSALVAALPVLATVLAVSLTPSSAHAQAAVLKAAAAEPGAEVSATGLDTVKVHYRGTFANGKEFDSSIQRGQPAEFPLNRVIKCWTEGVQRIKVGGKAKLTCPAAIAYGERGTPGGPIPPNATLLFEVELLGIAGK